MNRCDFIIRFPGRRKFPQVIVLGLVILLLGGVVEPVSAETAETLLTTFDFESSTPLAQWASEVDGKHQPLTVVTPGFRAEGDNKTKYSGQTSLRLEVVPDKGHFHYAYTPGIAIPLPNTPRRLRLTVYANTRGVTNKKPAYISVLEHKPQTGAFQWAGGKVNLVALPIADDWQKVQTEVALNPQTTTILIMFHFEEGTLWLDDLSVELLTEPSPTPKDSAR